MQTRTIGGMATYPGRQNLLPEVLQALSSQLSVLYIYLNEYNEIPKYLTSYNNIIPILGKNEFGNISANGKMYFLLKEKEGIAFTLDDDFIYPRNYVETFLEFFEKNKDMCFTVHGSVFVDSPSYYYERQKVFSAQQRSEKSNIVNMVGSGTCAFPLSLYQDINFDFTGDVYVDLHISLTALKKNMPILALARPAGWLKNIGAEGLWEQNRKMITHHTAIVRKNINYLRWNYLREVWKLYLAKKNFSLFQAACQLNLAPTSLDFLQGRDYLAFGSALAQLLKLKEFTDNINK